MTIKDQVLKKAKTYRSLLFYINLPVVVGIPFLLESGFLESMDPAKFDKTYMLL